MYIAIRRHHRRTFKRPLFHKSTGQRWFSVFSTSTSLSYRYNLELIYTCEFFKKLKLHEPRKHSRGGSAGRSFLKPSFLIRWNCFQSFRTKFHHHFTWYHWLRKFLSVFKPNVKSRITMCKLQRVYTFCTGVRPEALFALMSQLNGIALSRSESSNFFMYIIKAEFEIALLGSLIKILYYIVYIPKINDVNIGYWNARQLSVKMFAVFSAVS